MTLGCRRSPKKMSSNRISLRRGVLGHERASTPEGPAKPRDAGTIIVWRAGAKGVEVLMGRRSRRAAFVPSFFVFPGGRVDPDDYMVRPATPLNEWGIKRMGVRGNPKQATAIAIAAVREMFEEAGLLLCATGDIGNAEGAAWAHWRKSTLAPRLDSILYFGRAITSRVSPIRYHARFFIVHANALEGQIGNSDELSELGFYPASEVLAHMPIVDVTEFMLDRIVSYAAHPASVGSKTPVFAYTGDTPFVRYE
jgi:8-oxo-dGTP pyrophosphatase MutT (NUDIX family)